MASQNPVRELQLKIIVKLFVCQTNLLFAIRPLFGRANPNPVEDEWASTIRICGKSTPRRRKSPMPTRRQANKRASLAPLGMTRRSAKGI
jgi:hypothetical protein